MTDVYRSVGFALFQKQIAHAVGGKAFAHRSEKFIDKFEKLGASITKI